MNEWAEARGRMEAEIQRRKEHLNFATNFEKARGFVRKNWKTKNFNPNDDPTQYDSSTDSDELERQLDEEGLDSVSGLGDSPMKGGFPTVSDQIATLKAVQEYNASLKPARKVKDALPEITCNNITNLPRFKENPKTKKKVEVPHYVQVGIIEGRGTNGDQFSIEEKAKAI